MEFMSGIIIAVENFQDCIRFYRDGIGLPILMEKPGITSFQLGTMYLQIEDCAKIGLRPTRDAVLRRNVPGIPEVQAALKANGIELEVHDLDWGEIGIVFDPHGTKLEFFRKK